MSTATRIEELEIKCAYLERAVQELSDVVLRQQQQLDQALARVEELGGRIEAFEASDGGAAAPADPRAEIPPHY